MKLGHKLTLFALLCSVIPLFGMATLAFDAARLSLGEIVEKDLESIAEQEINDLEDYLHDTRAHLATWGRLGIMQDVMIDDSEGDLGDELVRLAEQYPMFAELLVVNSQGAVIASTDTRTVGMGIGSLGKLSAPVLNGEYQGSLRYSSRLNKRVITSAIPIRAEYSNSTIIGSLVGSLNWELIERELAARSVFGGKQDRQHLIVLQSVKDKKVLYSTREKQLSKEFLTAISSNVGVLEHQINQTNYVVASAYSAETDTVRNPHWILHVGLDTDIAYSTIQNLFKYILVIGVAAFLLMAILGYFLARAAVKPINALVIGAQGLAAGNYDSPVPVYNTNDEIGALTNSFISMRDAIKANELELIERTEISEEAARLKGEFLANMSHEVRTPINGVLGMTELLMNTELDETQGRYASTIFRSGQSLLSVINDILDFSKIEAGKLELQYSAFDLREVVEDVVELVAESAHKKGIEISALLPPDAHVAYQGDASRVRQILINLLGNAVKFTSEGEVKLTVFSEDNGTNQSLLRFEVVDTGIGIAAECQSQIFESFVQADGTTTRLYGGSGLGLAISAQLSELMDGDIGVSSEPGIGSTFWFTASVGKLSDTVEKAWQDNQSLKGKRILIVDDNRTNREILQAQVEYWGADFQLTASGHEALSALRAANEDSHPFDLAILDMHMPGMDGLSLTVAIKADQNLIHTRLILLSSVCDQLDTASYRAIGLESALTKPVRQPELFQCLTAVMANTPIESTLVTKVHKLEYKALAGRILIAEDNPVNQELISEMMNLMGVEYHVVGNGREAFDRFVNEHFDVVLMDCQMPIMDGFESTRMIRQHEKTQPSLNPTPIVALTANALQGDRESCIEQGMDEYLSKPVSSKQMYEMLGRWLDERTDEPNDDMVSKAPHLSVVPGMAGASDIRTAKQDESDIAALDSVAFAEIAAISAQASAGFLSRLILKFIDVSSNDIEKLVVKLAQGEAEEVKKVAHSLKGSAANLGAQHLAELCNVLESVAGTGNLGGMEIHLEKIKIERERVIEALHNECQRAA